MKFVVALLFCFMAAVCGSLRFDNNRDYGFDKPQNFARERKVNYYNGGRQAYVNYKAVAVGASSGTFEIDGVPGTGVRGHGYTGDGYAGYQHAGQKFKPGRFSQGVNAYRRG